MIATKQRPFDEILEMLENKQNIFLVGCGECATTCKTGGEKEIRDMLKKLQHAEKNITGWVVPQSSCTASQVKIAMAQHRDALSKSDAVLIFACGSGAQTFQNSDRMDLDVFSGNETLFIASINAQGSFDEMCSGCGECVLEYNEGMCPVTRCPKGLQNGPCGGQEKGMCEVDRSKDCVWISIYKRKAAKKRVDDLRKIRKSKDHSKSLRPQRISG